VDCSAISYSIRATGILNFSEFLQKFHIFTQKTHIFFAKNYHFSLYYWCPMDRKYNLTRKIFWPKVSCLTVIIYLLCVKFELGHIGSVLLDNIMVNLSIHDHNEKYHLRNVSESCQRYKIFFRILQTWLNWILIENFGISISKTDYPVDIFEISGRNLKFSTKIWKW